MFDRVRLAWKAWGLYDSLVAEWEGGRMNTAALVNLILSGLGVGLVTYVTAATAGSDMKAALSAAFSAAIGAVVQHLRGSPIDGASPIPPRA